MDRNQSIIFKNHDEESKMKLKLTIAKTGTYDICIIDSFSILIRIFHFVLCHVTCSSCSQHSIVHSETVTSLPLLQDCQIWNIGPHSILLETCNHPTMEPSFRPIQFAFHLPKHPHLNLHAHLSLTGNCVMVHLTTTDIGESENSAPPMGSFVYAMPDVRILPMRLQHRNLPSTIPTKRSLPTDASLMADEE